MYNLIPGVEITGEASDYSQVYRTLEEVGRLVDAIREEMEFDGVEISEGDVIHLTAQGVRIAQVSLGPHVDDRLHVTDPA